MLKRIFLLSIMFLFLCGSIADAEIIKGKDDFTGGKTCYSTYKFSSDESICFTKIYDKNLENYELEFWKKSLLGENYARIPIEIKVDDNPIQKIEVKEINSLPTDPFSRTAPVVISNKADISQSIIGDIKDSRRVALKAYKDKYSPVIVVLPDTVLAEWKEVIETEE